jgi:hypothetical protein
MHEMVGDDEEKFYSMCHTQDKSIPQDLFNSVFKMALTCTCQKKKGRPEMKMVNNTNTCIYLLVINEHLMFYFIFYKS